jgi:hypothetical protein
MPEQHQNFHLCNGAALQRVSCEAENGILKQIAIT